jgi:hypothetical protein
VAGAGANLEAALTPGIRTVKANGLYHGVLGPRAAWRSEVIPCAASEEDRDVGKESATEQALDADPAETARRQARGQCWASLMARTFGLAVLACPRTPTTSGV